MTFLTTYFTSTPTQLLTLAAVLLLSYCMSVIGAAVGGRNRYAPADLMVGWAVTALVFTTVGTLTLIPFTYITIALAIVAAGSTIYVWRRDRRLLPAGTAKILAMNALLFLLISSMASSQWDEYSHWLLVPRYLLENDMFARIGMPVPMADYPGYPTGASLIPYLVSRIVGSFQEAAAPLFHVILLISMSLAAMDLIRIGAKLDQTKNPSWGLCALGFMTVTIFSTAFVQKVIFTAYADLPVAAAVAFSGVLCWMVLQALSKNNETQAWTYAIQAGLVLMILLNLKPATIVLFVGVLGGTSFAVLRDPDVQLSKFLKLMPALILPGIFILLLWGWFSSTHFHRGGHSVMPFDNWQWHHMGQTLLTITSIMMKKGFYFGMMLVLTAFSIVALFRIRSQFDRFALIAGCTFVGYNLFLVFVYLAIFHGYSGANALSYWRYNMHLAHLGVFCAAYGLSILWHEKLAGRFGNTSKHLAKLTVVVLILLPVAFAPKLRFDIRAPKQFVKQVGAEMASILPKGARVMVLDPLANGFYAKLMRYQLYGVATLSRDISLFHPKKLDYVRKYIEESNSTHMWVHTQSKDVVEVLGVPLKERNAHLLEKQGAGWRLIKSWPYPGYNNPNDIPD